MKTYFTYYVVDTVTESIFGYFDAISLDMAVMMMKKSILDNPKVSDFANQLAVYKAPEKIPVRNDYDEIVKDCEFVSSDVWKPE